MPRFAFTALAGLLSLQSVADALRLPKLRPTAARAPVLRMDALSDLAAMKAQLAELEQAKLALELKQVTAALEQAKAEAATTPVPEVIATTIAVPAPIPDPVLALPSTSVPELSIPSMPSLPSLPSLPSMPEATNVLPAAKAIAAPAADAVNPLLIDAAIVVSLPLLAAGITAYVGLLTGGELPQAAVADTGPAEKRGMGAQPTTEGSRSAPEIFFSGLENLGKEPFGWFFGGPSPLTGASLAPATPQQSTGRQLGAKERARVQAAASPPQDDYAAIIAAEFRQKNLMVDGGQPMSGLVTPTAGVAPPKPPPVAPPPKPVAVVPPPEAAVAVAPTPAAAVAPPKPVAPPPKTAPPPPKAVPPRPPPIAVAPLAAEPVEAAPVESGASEEGSASSMSAAERMLQLKELLEDGLLSQAEYDEKRLDILNSI